MENPHCYVDKIKWALLKVYLGEILGGRISGCLIDLWHLFLDSLQYFTLFIHHFILLFLFCFGLFLHFFAVLLVHFCTFFGHLSG